MSKVVLEMSIEDAERLSLGMSDLLCWVRGYCAAKSDSDWLYGPVGCEEVREMNIKLKEAWRKAAKQ